MTDLYPHVSDLLPSYLNGTLQPNERDRVERHVSSCTACQRELEEWHALGVATVRTFENVPVPSPDVLDQVKSRIERPIEEPDRAARLVLSFSIRYLWQLVTGQLWLVHRGIWLAAPLTIALGLLAGLTAQGAAGSAIPIALIAPALAAVSLALIYGPENDPSLELALSTPTSPRLVLMARMTLVFGYDLLIALAATAVLVVVDNGTNLWPLISMWIVPMLFLSAFALTMSLVFGTSAAIAASLILWTVRVYAFTDVELHHGTASEMAEMVHAFWESGPLLIALVVCLMIITIVSVPRQERFA